MVELEQEKQMDDPIAEQVEAEQPVTSPQTPLIDQPALELEPVEPEIHGGRKSPLAQPWILLVLGLLIGGLAGFSLRPLVIPEAEDNTAPLAGVAASDQINEPDPHQAVMLAVIAGARHYDGDPNAPVTLIEFGDFNCGYCGRWAHETLPLIREKYIKTGKVRMAYVHFPILGADSMTAAEATECAAQQENFWDYHNLLYANQGAGFTPANLTNLAGEMGLDTAAFAQCLANFPGRKSLEDDIRLSQVMGVRGTPAFLVNGIALAGAYPYEDFEQIIESELARLGGAEKPASGG